jgi:hypothetical protein
MLFLLPSFFIILIVAYIYGIVPFVLLKKPLPMNPITPMFIGFGVLGILSQWFMIGGAINFFVLIVIAVGALVAPWRYGFYYQTHYTNLFNWFKSLNTFTLVSFGLILLLILYQSALPTKINDMGAYYLQTLQWMQAYGAVKGLGNLHPALGLGSAWHSLLSMFQLPSLPAFYAINGSLILTVYVWLTFELKSAFTTKEKLPNPLTKLNLILNGNKDEKETTKFFSNYKQLFIIAYSLVFFPLGFLYLTAPSPDLPLLAFTPLIFYWLVLEKNILNAELLLIIACFIFAVKPPALIAIATGIMVMVNSFRKSNPETLTQILETPKNTSIYIAKKLAINVFILALCLSPTLYKNYLQTGYLLYPLSLSKSTNQKVNNHLKNSAYTSNNLSQKNKGIDSTLVVNLKLNTLSNDSITANLNTSWYQNLISPKWQIPADWNKAYRQGIVSWGLSDSSHVQAFKDPLPPKKTRLLAWLTRPGYKGLMNKILALNFLIACLLLFAKTTWVLRGYQLLLLFITIFEWLFLTQYRLMLPTGLTLFCLNVLVFGSWSMGVGGKSLGVGLWSLVRLKLGLKGGALGHSSSKNVVSGTVTSARKIDIERTRSEPSSYATETSGKKIPIEGVRSEPMDERLIQLGKVTLIIPIIIYALLAFVPMTAFQKESRNKKITETNGFTSAFLVQPYTDYNRGELNSFMVDSIPFHFYNNRSYAWNAPLPAVSESHRRFLETNFGYKLRAFSTKIEDGFYLEKFDY